MYKRLLLLLRYVFLYFIYCIIRFDACVYFESLSADTRFKVPTKCSKKLR